MPHDALPILHEVYQDLSKLRQKLFIAETIPDAHYQQLLTLVGTAASAAKAAIDDVQKTADAAHHADMQALIGEESEGEDIPMVEGPVSEELLLKPLPCKHETFSIHVSHNKVVQEGTTQIKHMLDLRVQCQACRIQMKFTGVNKVKPSLYVPTVDPSRTLLRIPITPLRNDAIIKN